MKKLLVSACALCVILALSACASAVPSGKQDSAGFSPLVQLEQGSARGFTGDHATLVWKGIPYAAAPVGDLRWKAPRAPLTWAGVRDMKDFASPSVQRTPVFTDSITGSEDCLYLNVWRPDNAKTNLPVYVWIHGGGNTIGSANMADEYQGDVFSSQGNLVFVSINYRLGPMGWFSHPALRDGAAGLDASANFGLLDILQALTWVKANIAAFGGDPGRVCVGGESAGAFDILSLLLTEESAGLFTSAIVQSGATSLRTLSSADEQGRTIFDKILVRQGKAKTLDAARSVQDSMSAAQIRTLLQGVDAKTLVSLYDASPFGMTNAITLVADDVLLPTEGFAILEKGSYPIKVPLIVGGNLEETKLFTGFAPGANWQNASYQAFNRLASARWRTSGSERVADAQAAIKGSPPVYVYRFDWGAPDEKGTSVLGPAWGKQLGAFHNEEIPFFFGKDTLDVVFHVALFTDANKVGRKALSLAMLRYAAAFASTGDPGSGNGDLPSWLPWTSDNTSMLVFDATNSALNIREETRAAAQEKMNAELSRLSPAERADVDKRLAESATP